MGPPAPQRLGRYQILRHVAAGDLADVFLARAAGAHGPDHHVIKRTRPDRAIDGAYLRVFLDEGRKATYLRHPNIVCVHELALDGGAYYVAMEYVHGEDLQRVLACVRRASDQVPIALVTGIVAAVAGALHHAHTLAGLDGAPLGIVHRDVSPSNILIGYDGIVKIGDFGGAKSALPGGVLRGRVSYLAPEQVVGAPVDRRADVFALGAVLYELATTRRLFHSANDFFTMSAIAHGEVPPPSQFRPDLPRTLEDIVLRALAPAPGDRFQTADELRAALEAFAGGLGMRASPASIADYLRKLFGGRALPWQVAPGESAGFSRAAEAEDDAVGVAAPPERAVRDLALPPGVHASSDAPIVYARAELGRAAAPTMPTVQMTAAAEPSRTPQAWASEPPRGGRRRTALAIGAVTIAALVGAGVAVATSRSSGERERPAVAAPAAAPTTTATPATPTADTPGTTATAPASTSPTTASTAADTPGTTAAAAPTTSTSTTATAAASRSAAADAPGTTATAAAPTTSTSTTTASATAAAPGTTAAPARPTTAAATAASATATRAGASPAPTVPATAPPPAPAIVTTATTDAAPAPKARPKAKRAPKRKPSATTPEPAPAETWDPDALFPK